ncbi:MAG: peptidylprolyl isomerase [Verrucomicrobia bacterium]|nr:peptidylprolyl isomerase [Verrucomicrobiota bacterium]
MLSRLSALFLATLVPAASSANVAPVLLQDPVQPVILLTGEPAVVDLAALVRDPDVARSVRLTVRTGAMVQTVDFALFPAEKPITTANFLAYVAQNRYANSFCHRLVRNFVLQGGGYTADANTNVGPVPTLPPIPLEANGPGHSNVRGTLSMARALDPGSATSQWFINLVDNSAPLDTASGGYAAFGRVLGSGMAAIDTLGQLQIVNAGGVFAELPVVNYTGGQILRPNLVLTDWTEIAPVSFSAVSTTPRLLSASVQGSQLVLTPPPVHGTGGAMVAITATDLEGGVLNFQLPVQIRQRGYSEWAAAIPFPDQASAAPGADPDGDGLSNLEEFGFGGDPLRADRAPGLPAVDSAGRLSFQLVPSAGLIYRVERSTGLDAWQLVWSSDQGFQHPNIASTSTANGRTTVTVQLPGAVDARAFWRVGVEIRP